MSYDQQFPGWKIVSKGVTRLMRSIQVLWSERVVIPRVRVLTLMGMCALIGSVLIVHGTPQAFALQAEPTNDWSYYIYSASTSTAYTLGCDQGKYDSSHSNVNSEVILDVGGEYSDTGGALTFSRIVLSNAQVEAIAEAFSQGYWVCTGSDSTSILRLGIGTNNSYSGVSYAGGQSWANMVAAVDSYNSAQGYNSQVAAEGANDIEPSWWNPSDSLSWSQGYASVSNSLYIDYGSADGCPQNSSDNTIGCNNGWSQYDVWYVAWGSPPAMEVPEVYNTAQASQWAMLSLYGAQHQNSAIYMQGPLDDYWLDNSSLTPAQSWYYLWTDLNNNSDTAQNMPFALEMHIDCQTVSC